MNTCTLIGRLTREPEYSETQSGTPKTTFSLAIDRPKRQDGTQETDFPRVIVFGKQAENCRAYLGKGLLCAVQGRIQTGSYVNREGQKVYTTDVLAERVEFLQFKERGNQQGNQQEQGYQGQGYQQNYRQGGYQSQGYQGQGEQQSFGNYGGYDREGR